MIKPLGHRVIAKEIKPEEKSVGGIIIPTNAQEQPQEAIVLAVGPGELKADGTRLPMSVKVGDRIAYGKYAPTEIKVEGQTYLIVSEKDILAVTSEEPETTHVVIHHSEIDIDAVDSVGAQLATRDDGGLWLDLFVKGDGELCWSKSVPVNDIAKAQELVLA